MPNLLIRFKGHYKDSEMYMSYAIFRTWKEQQIEMIRETKVPSGAGTKDEAELGSLLRALDAALNGLLLAGMDSTKFNVTILHDSKEILNWLKITIKNNTNPCAALASRCTAKLSKFNIHFVHHQTT